MPSLRRSLIGYFLLLLACALVGVGVLIDRFAHEALEARELAERKRIVQEYETHCADSQEKFNAELEIQAQSLGRELRSKYADVNKQAVDESYKKFPLAMAAYALGDLGSPLGTVINGALAHQSPAITAWFPSSARNARNVG